MKCLSCGSNIPDNAMFCPQCGANAQGVDEENRAVAEGIASARRLVADGRQASGNRPDIAGIEYRKALEVVVNAYISKLGVSDAGVQGCLDSAGYGDASRSGRLYQRILFLESAGFITANQASDAHFVRQFGNSCAHSDEGVSSASARTAGDAITRLIDSLEPMIFSARRANFAEFEQKTRSSVRNQGKSNAFNDVMKGTVSDLAGCGKSCLLVTIWLSFGFVWVFIASMAPVVTFGGFNPGATLNFYVIGVVLWIVLGIFLSNVEKRW